MPKCTKKYTKMDLENALEAVRTLTMSKKLQQNFIIFLPHISIEFQVY